VSDAQQMLDVDEHAHRSKWSQSELRLLQETLREDANVTSSESV